MWISAPSNVWISAPLKITRKGDLKRQQAILTKVQEIQGIWYDIPYFAIYVCHLKGKRQGILADIQVG